MGYKTKLNFFVASKFLLDFWHPMALKMNFQRPWMLENEFLTSLDVKIFLGEIPIYVSNVYGHWKIFLIDFVTSKDVRKMKAKIPIHMMLKNIFWQIFFFMSVDVGKHSLMEFLMSLGVENMHCKILHQITNIYGHRKCWFSTFVDYGKGSLMKF